jgi:farnesyl-diphosphate farnesyltransferase
MTHLADLLRILENTSRTFFIPIVRLPPRLQDAVASAYLCMRAIDEIEDHSTLETNAKVVLLRRLGLTLQAYIGLDDPARLLALLSENFAPYKSALPEVTLRIGEWLLSAPTEIAPRVWDATIAMAERMAFWAGSGWRIQTKADLDGYTFSVAGAVGLLLSDIWGWFDGSQIERNYAVQFGRGLQAVNIIRNRAEDLQRGVDFYPAGWTDAHMFSYAGRHLTDARAAIQCMPGGSFVYFVQIPLSLAEATLTALENGQQKLTRSQVLQIVGQT